MEITSGKSLNIRSNLHFTLSSVAHFFHYSLLFSLTTFQASRYFRPPFQPLPFFFFYYYYPPGYIFISTCWYILGKEKVNVNIKMWSESRMCILVKKYAICWDYFPEGKNSMRSELTKDKHIWLVTDHRKQATGKELDCSENMRTSLAKNIPYPW